MAIFIGHPEFELEHPGSPSLFPGVSLCDGWGISHILLNPPIANVRRGDGLGGHGFTSLLVRFCIFGCNFAPNGWALCNGQLCRSRRTPRCSRCSARSMAATEEPPSRCPTCRAACRSIRARPWLSNYVLGRRRRRNRDPPCQRNARAQPSFSQALRQAPTTSGRRRVRPSPQAPEPGRCPPAITITPRGRRRRSTRARFSH